MPTRRDVANLAGVSEAVVSYVINNNRYVAPEKRELVLQNLQRVVAYAQDDEDEFVKRVMENKLAVQRTEQERSKRKLEKQKRRITELDAIIQRLYEDNVTGKLTDERFAKLSATYEAEQAELIQSIESLSVIVEASIVDKKDVTAWNCYTMLLRPPQTSKTFFMSGNPSVCTVYRLTERGVGENSHPPRRRIQQPGTRGGITVPVKIKSGKPPVSRLNPTHVKERLFYFALLTPPLCSASLSSLSPSWTRWP